LLLDGYTPRIYHGFGLRRSPFRVRIHFEKVPRFLFWTFWTVISYAERAFRQVAPRYGYINKP
jgi:hypothetical protein